MEEMYRKVEGLFPDADERGKVWAALLYKRESDRAFYLLGVDNAVRSTLRSLLPSPGREESKNDLRFSLVEDIKDLKESLSEVAGVLSKGIALALKPMTAQLRRNPSIAQSKNTSRIDGFKKELVNLYLDVEGPVAEIRCHVTGLLLPSFEVIAGHIFPMRAHPFINDFCPDLVNINDSRNGILWAAPIEQAFEMSCMCFHWDEITHTLTPIVLDKNLLGKNMYEAIQYMREIASGSTAEEGLQSEELSTAEERLQSDAEEGLQSEESSYLTSEDVKRKMQEISDLVQSMKLKPKKALRMRRKKYESSFRHYINECYKNVFLDSLHMKQKQFPKGVNMSGRAFKVTAIFAFQEAKRRGVLPVDLSFDPYSDTMHYDSIDVYLSNQVSVSELCDDFNAYDLDSEDTSSGLDSEDALSVGVHSVRCMQESSFYMAN